MAVAEPASQTTVRTIGGILLAAFFAASVGFYVHTTQASSEDSPRDMQPGFVYQVRAVLSSFLRAALTLLALQSNTAMISMNANGEGTLTPADAALAKASRNNNHAPQQQQAAASASALLRGARKSSGVESRAQGSRALKSPANRLLKHADARQFYAKQKAALQQDAHKRLQTHSGSRPSRPATFAERKARASAALAAKSKAAQRRVAQRVVAETKAIREMENRIAGDIASAFKCVDGSNCLERGLVDAERAAQKLLSTSTRKASALAHKDAASRPLNLGQKFKKPKGYGAAAQDPANALGPAASNAFWKEAAVIAEKGPEALHRKTKNSAKAFVKQLAAVTSNQQHPKELAPAVFEIPAISTGPMSSPKSKTFT